MQTLFVKGGSTDVSVVIRIIDSTDGTPETGVTAATSGLDLEYRREGAVSVDLTESNLSALSDAHSDGGLLHIANGYYRVDLPDAAVAAGSSGVLVHGTATGMVVIGAYLQLGQVPADVTHFGGSAGTFSGGRPEVNASHAGGTAWGSGAITAGAIAADAIGASELAADAASEIATAVATALGTGSGFTAIPWNAAWDAEAQSECADALTAYGAATGANVSAVETDTQDIQSRLPAALVSGRIDASVGAMAANTLTASALAADAVTEFWTTALTEAYSTDGAAPTPAQALCELLAMGQELSISGTTMTIKKRDGSTTAMTLTLDSSTTPTSVTRAS